MTNPTTDRLMHMVLDAIEWAIEVSDDTTHDLLRGMGITSDELEELGYEKEEFPEMHKWVKGENEADNPVAIEDPDSDTPLSIRDSKLRVDWYNAGEGWNGDYDPENPEDDNLLRFDVYVKTDDPSWEHTGGWEAVEDGSYCTRVPADTDPKELKRLLEIIFENYREVIEDYINNGTSVKKLGESLSWISPRT